MDVESGVTFLILLFFNGLCMVSAMRFEYCLMFRGSCQTSCGPGTFSLYGSTWCSLNRLCCITPYRPPTNTTTTSTATATATTTTVSTTTTPSTTSTTTTAAATTTTPLQKCGVPKRATAVTGRIIGGREADRCELPWMVYISNSPCGGALLDHRHILTAAHCFRSASGYRPELTIGEYNRSESATTEKFSTTDYKVIIHPEYIHQYYFNDIAILRLNVAFDYDKYGCVQPLCLPSANQSFPAGTVCTVAGWGVTEPEYDISSPPTSQVLMKVRLPIVEESLCVSKFSKYYSRSIQTCAGQLEGSKDSCDGDSGGPLMCQTGDGNEYYAAGIVSSGVGCAQPQTPAIYTDVVAFLPWIHSVINSAQ